MKISDLFKTTSDAVCGTINGALTIRENLLSKIQDINSFLDEDSSVVAISLSVPDSSDSTKSYLAQLTKTQFNDALNNEQSEFTLPISDVDDVTLTGEKIVEYFTRQTEQLKIQESFFDYCCSNVEEVTSSDFLTRLSNMTANLAPATYSLYTKCIDLASTPIEALKNFFGSTSAITVSTDADNKITIVDLTQYGGDAWSVGITNIFDTVTSFFTGLWQGLYKIGEFFKGVLDAIVKVGKWLFGRAFGYLFTVYTKQGKQSFGYMDLPVLQITDQLSTSPLNYVSLYQYNLYATNQEQNIITYPWNGYAYRAILNEAGRPDVYLYALCHQYGPGYTGNTAPAVRDVIIPSKPYNMLLRFGVTTDEKNCVSMYPCFTVEETSAWSDAEIESNIRESVLSALKVISNVCPFLPISQNSEDVDLYFEEFVNMILPSSLTGKLAVDLDGKLVGVDASDLIPDSGSYTPLDPSPLHLLVGLVNYGALMSDVFFNTQLTGQFGPYLPTMFPVEKDYNFDFETYPFVDEIDSFDTNDWNKNTYRPYNKSCLTPCTVHYQTTEEEAREVEYTLVGLILAVTITVAVVKTAISLKNLRIKAEISQATVDSLSWQVADNPSAANLAAYKKARKKNNRIQRLMRTLGMLPRQTAINTSDFDLLMNGDTPAASIDPIIKLIK